MRAMLVLATMLAQMKANTPLGSRIAEVRDDPGPELRDTEQAPPREPDGIAGFIAGEVRPPVPDP